jgi:hypothetical protein
MAYPELTRRTAFAAAVESTPGVDAAPTLAANAIRLAGPLVVEEFYLQENSRDDVLFGGLGTLAPEAPAGRALRMRGRAVLVGHGAAYGNTALPEVHPLLAAAGLVPTVDAATVGSETVAYATSDDANTTITAVAFQSGKLYRLTRGVVDSFTLQADAGGFPILSFSVVGVAEAPTEQPLGTIPATDDVAYPIWRGADSLEVGGATSLVPRSMTAALELAVAARSDANGSDAHAGYRITRRHPSLHVRAEVPALGAWNPYQERAQRTPRGITARFGQTQYQRVTLEVPAALAVDVNDTDENGMRVYDVQYLVTRASGGADLTLTFD